MFLWSLFLQLSWTQDEKMRNIYRNLKTDESMSLLKMENDSLIIINIWKVKNDKSLTVISKLACVSGNIVCTSKRGKTTYNRTVYVFSISNTLPLQCLISWHKCSSLSRSRSLYYLPHNSFDVSLENSLLDQLIIC